MSHSLSQNPNLSLCSYGQVIRNPTVCGIALTYVLFTNLLSKYYLASKCMGKA